MASVADNFPWGLAQSDFTHFNGVLGLAPIPLFFLGLPSVKHFCETTPTGPLALPCDTIAIPNPPEIVTIHPRAMLHGTGPVWLPPIVLGATNRLVFRSAMVAASLTDSGEDILFVDLMPEFYTLFTILDRPILDCNIVDRRTSSSRPISLDNTKIELYGYIRHRNETKLTGDPDLDSALPSDLSHIQAMFDDNLGRWKGKVELKNREDCPPCSACGLEGH